MLCHRKTKRSLLILLVITVVVGLTMTVWAKKPPKPPGGGGEPADTGTIYYAHNKSLWSMNPDGSGKTLQVVGGVPSMTRHPAEADRWFLQVQEIDGFYPITTFPAEYYWSSVWGIDDLEAVGFAGDPNTDSAWDINYYIEIDDANNPDTFKWYASSSVFEGGSTPEVTGVPITGGDQKLVYDSTCLTIKFGSTTGHIRYDPFGDAWSIRVTKTQRHELFAVREDGLIEVQLTDDPNVQPRMPGASPRWATHDGVADGKVSYLAQRWGKDAQNEDVVLERGLFATEINWDEWGEPYATTVTTKLPVSLPLELMCTRYPYDWSPDGDSIVYWANGIWVANVYEEPNEWLCDGWAPIWSPVLDDGSTLIAFEIGSWGDAEIRTISPGGGPETTIVALGKNRTIWGGMDWSPNGTHLIYTHIQSKACRACQHNDSYDVYRVGADGSDSTNLTNDLQENAFSMGWRD